MFINWRSSKLLDDICQKSGIRFQLRGKNILSSFNFEKNQ